MPNYRSWMTLLAVLMQFSGFVAAAPQAQAPETLIWTYTDFHDLRTNAKSWHDVKGIDGFLFCFVNQRDGGPVRWDSGADKVNTLYAELPETVAALRKAGITANFVNANMAGDTFSWFDAKQVQCIVDTFRAMARIAKQSDCRGVAIDTEPYFPAIWDPDKYPADQRDALRQIIRKAGVDIMDAILSEFPKADIIIYPEGAYVDLKNAPGGYHIYGNWGVFVNGLVSTKPDQGLTVLTECDYQWKDPVEIIKLHGEVNAATQLAMEDQLYWMHKCGIGHGAGIYDGKNGHMSWQTPQQFAEQWKTMGQLSAKYRFIFAGESNCAYYPQGAGKCGIAAFSKPLAKDADQYFKVIRDDRKPR